MNKSFFSLFKSNYDDNEVEAERFDENDYFSLSFTRER